MIAKSKIIRCSVCNRVIAKDTFTGVDEVLKLPKFIHTEEKIAHKPLYDRPKLGHRGYYCEHCFNLYND